MVSRWWRASASFPVIAGLLCAMAIMFNVCALSQGWHETIDLAGSASIIAQPAWIIALKAVSLALATIAYTILLLTTMSKRDPAQGFIVIILCWCASATVLFIVIGIVAGQKVTVDPNYTLHYTQNFFYGIFSAGLYIVIAILLGVYTASVRSIHLSREERRTVECISIMLRAIALGVFLLGGAAVYATIEGWGFMDALYWADYSLLTIGIGNIVPKTRLGQSLLIPYCIAGITTVGLVISSIASFSRDLRELHLRFKIRELHIHTGNDSSLHSSRHNKEKHSLRPTAIPSKSEILRVQQIESDFFRRRRWTVFIVSAVAWFLLWLVSAAVFARSEVDQHWSYFRSLYFTFTSLTTIGYGDLYPTSNLGKAFFVFWSLLAVPVLTHLVSSMGQLGFQKMARSLSSLWRMRFSPWQTIGNDNGSALRNQKGSEPIDQNVPNKLLLGEEIGRLVSTLKDRHTKLDLHSEWIRILPLLNTGGDEEEGLFETTAPASVHGHARIMKEAMAPHRSTVDTHKEILWMLQFLTEKLCADLREELYREAR